MEKTNILAPKYYLSNETLVNFRYPLHKHDHIEIVYVISGELLLQIEENKYTLSAGEVALILPNNCHLYYTDKKSKSQIVVLSNNFASELVDNYSMLNASNPIIKIDNIAKIMNEYSKRKPNYYMIKANTNYIGYKYIENNTFTNKNIKIVEFINKVLDYIENNYNINPKLDELASNLGYSSNYLSSLLNNIFNKSFNGMINEKRIAKSIELLKNSTKPINEIASLCGYNNIRSFNRNFLLINGIAPSDYRQ